MPAQFPSCLKRVFANVPDLAFAVLIGSRATKSERPDSDWDIAVSWKPSADTFHHLARHEKLRQAIAESLMTGADSVDLVDLTTARLAMRAVVADDGKVIHMNDELAWAYFQTSTWRQLEEFYWDRAHAA